MPEPEWLKNAQQLAEMVRELRKAQSHVEQIQKNIRRFLRTRGCCRHVPWGASGSAKDNGDADLELPNERTVSDVVVQGLQFDQRNTAAVQLAVVNNGSGNQYECDHSHDGGAEVFRGNEF